MIPERELRRGGDEGLTLIEIAVVLLIMSIAITLITGMLISVQHEESTVQSRNAAVHEAQVMGYTLSRQVHAAAFPTGASTPIVTATATDLKLYSSLGNANGPTQLDIHAVRACGSCSYYNLVEDVVQPGPGPTYTGSPQRQVIGTGLLLPATSPASDCPGSGTFVSGIFEYFTQAGSCLALDTALNPPGLDTAGGPPTEIAQVENITITLTTVDTLAAKSGASTTIALPLSLPNWDYTYG